MKFFIFLVVFFFGISCALQAKQPYDAEIFVETSTARVVASNLTTLSNELRTTAIQKLIPVYTPTSAVELDFNLRGLLATASIAENSTAIVFTLPQLGITQTFQGSTRDESAKLLQVYLRNNGENNQALFKAYAKYTSIDPIAGNPNSLLSQMAIADYALGELAPLQGCSPCWSAQPTKHLFHFSSGYLHSTASQQFDTVVYGAPFRYSYSPNRNRAFILDLPVQLIKNGGGYSLATSIGFGARFPITSRWSLTPILRASLGGSLDLSTAGSILSAGLNSVFTWKFKWIVFSLINYAGYFNSISVHQIGINFNYQLHNGIFKNGCTLTTCQGYSLLGRPVHLQFAFTDTDFQGTPLFISHYDEVSLSLIVKNINKYLESDCGSLGLTYQWGERKYRAYAIRLDYLF